ncbi:MAG: hypothetical protein GX964_07405 [Syntrophomonadaceae bacterium]|jgi:putative protease|nr:hypothetical protein [Syntrophomonadaceae bacterium]
MGNNQPELLAPAGKWETMESAVQNGADAVYLGGKRFNMRLLRPDFNFSDEQIRDAVSYCHEHGVRLYITVNNLYYQSELDELAEYLGILEKAGVDALIVQDLAVVQLAGELGLRVPLHASVQMNVANLEGAQLLENMGFTRVILSKDLSQQEILEISRGTSLGLEYFVHGDLCISHAGQCYMSSFLFGESGNRGRCRKPCRWAYVMDPEVDDYPGKHYFLAHKDLCLVTHLGDLIEAGVTSFKVEGRMREPEYVGFLVRCYRQALDAWLRGDGLETARHMEEELQRRRVRDFSTGSLFGTPGAESIGYSGEREPHFPTHPVQLRPLTVEECPVLEPPTRTDGLRLTVKTGDIQAFQKALNQGVDTLVIGGDNFHQIEAGWSSKSLQQAVELGKKNDTSVVLELPRIVSQRDLPRVQRLLALPGLQDLPAVMVNDLGTWRMVRELGLPVWAGYGLNITNARALQLAAEMGAKLVTLSRELKLAQLEAVLQVTNMDVEVVVHGPLCGMVSDYCAVGSTRGCQRSQVDGLGCREGEFYLLDEYGQKFRILTDQQCRSHIFYPHDLCLFGYLPLFADLGVHSVRIEGQYYDQEVLMRLIEIFRSAIQEMGQWNAGESFSQLLELFPGGLTDNPLRFEEAGLRD